MKQLEKILSTVCVITTAVYFLSAMLLVLGQAGALFMLNGELCAAIFNTVKVQPGMRQLLLPFCRLSCPISGER